MNKMLLIAFFFSPQKRTQNYLVSFPKFPKYLMVKVGFEPRPPGCKVYTLNLCSLLPHKCVFHLHRIFITFTKKVFIASLHKSQGFNFPKAWKIKHTHSTHTHIMVNFMSVHLKVQYILQNSGTTGLKYYHDYSFVIIQRLELPRHLGDNQQCVISSFPSQY